MSLSMRIFLVMMAAVFFVLPSSIYAFEELNQNTIKEMLREPGVKLIAVDFYATWCDPCNKAIPKWKKLQEKYGSKGLKIVVISVQSGGSCAQPPNWTPDKIICDYEGEISNRWNAQSLPQAFLWSWQGNLLVANGQAEDVGKAIEQYFMKIPRVLVEEPADKTIYKLVRSELIKNSKMEILASEKEMAALRELSEKSHQMNYDEKLECVLGQEVSANSRLTISKQKRGSKEFLILELFSIEKGCLVASGISSVQGDIETVVAQASYNLLKNLFGDVVMPGKKESAEFKTGKMGKLEDEWNPDMAGSGEQAVIYFESDPQGATVSIDENVVGKTPDFKSKMLASGKHQIKMEKEGFYTETKILDLKKGTPVKFTLFPGIKINSNPTGAMVRIDGKMLCESTPCEKVVDEGEREIIVQKDLYSTKKQIISVQKGKNIQIDLEPNFGWLEIESAHSGVNVVLDGKNIGKTPIQKRQITPGAHLIEPQGECFNTVPEQFVVEKGKTHTINLGVQQKEGAIQVSAKDEKGNDIEATVIVDGKNVGSAPGTFKISICSKTILLQSANLEYKEDVNISEKQLSKINGVLKIKDRFTIKDKVVVDNKTTLMWQRNINAKLNIFFIEAKQYCAELVLGGYSDWRIPIVEELKTLNGWQKNALETPYHGRIWAGPSFINEFGYEYAPYLNIESGEQRSYAVKQFNGIGVLCVRTPSKTE